MAFPQLKVLSMDPKTILQNAANDLLNLSNSADSDKIHMCEMAQLPLQLLQMMNQLTKDLKDTLTSMRDSVTADKEANKQNPNTAVVQAEDSLLAVLETCLSTIGAA